MVIADGGNWKLGEPTLCTTLRGHGKLTVTLRTLENALHSGQFGGAAPDALLALIRLLATLDHVEGLQDSTWDGADLPEADFRRQAGVLEGVELTGRGTVADRLWARHAISVLGLDAPAVEGAGNIVIPSARAKIAVRIPPGADPQASMDTVERHLRTHATTPLEIEIEAASSPIALPVHQAALDALQSAYTKPVAVMGSGGSIPLVAALHATFPDAAIILWGAQDSDLAKIHATGESVALDEIEKIAQAEAHLLSALSG
jgi:acetylornithine deacetylase/succinyl-diaminopimelate desuccinylase-like protein